MAAITGPKCMLFESLESCLPNDECVDWLVYKPKLKSLYVCEEFKVGSVHGRLSSGSTVKARISWATLLLPLFGTYLIEISYGREGHKTAGWKLIFRIFQFCKSIFKQDADHIRKRNSAYEVAGYLFAFPSHPTLLRSN
jgi:hypothetical protein